MERAVKKLVEFCDQWTVPLITSAPPAFLHVSLKQPRDPCGCCGKRRCSIKQSQLVLFRDYVGTGLTISFVNYGAVSHYERAPSYTMVFPRMCGACEDAMVDLVASQDFPRCFHLPPAFIEPHLDYIQPLISLINDYTRLEHPFMSLPG